LTSKKSKKEGEMNGDRMENEGIMDKGGKRDERTNG
jgi:hypothetical protein